MPRYLARVELHDADEDDYNTLHEAMRLMGFKKTLTTNDGVRRKLPTGTYKRDLTLLGMAAVFRKVETAAKSTGLDYEIIVSQIGATKVKLSRASRADIEVDDQ